MTWNYIDIIFLIPLAYAVYKGLKNGFIIEFAGMIALFLGIWGAFELSDFTADFMINQMKIESSSIGLISFFITFILILIIVYLIAKVITKVIDAAALGVLNKILGLVFSLIKMVFILSVSVLMLKTYDKENKLITAEQQEESFLYKPISFMAPALFPYLDMEKLINTARDKNDERKEPVNTTTTQ